MILKPRVLLMVIATGIFWLLALLSVLLLVAGLTGAGNGLLVSGAVGTTISALAWLLFNRNETGIRQWVQRR